MTEPATEYPAVFFEVFEALPRQGPGDRASTTRALAACTGLPPAPRIADLGCGSGSQSIDLAELTGGVIIAVDNHAPFLPLVKRAAEQAGVGDRVETIHADMATPGIPPASLDVMWAEGALYQIGINAGLQLASNLLRPGGYLVFTEAVWRRDNPPTLVREAFDYPAMGTVDDVVSLIDTSPFTLIEHFPLPENAWWESFYAPMQSRVAALRGVHASDPEALATLDVFDAEIEMHQQYGDFYGYEFFVAQLSSAAHDS